MCVAGHLGHFVRAASNPLFNLNMYMHYCCYFGCMQNIYLQVCKLPDRFVHESHLILCISTHRPLTVPCSAPAFGFAKKGFNNPSMSAIHTLKYITQILLDPKLTVALLPASPAIFIQNSETAPAAALLLSSL